MKEVKAIMRKDWALEGAEMFATNEATDEEICLKADDFNGCDVLETLCTDEDEFNEEYSYTRLQLADGRIVSVLTFDLDWEELI